MEASFYTKLEAIVRAEWVEFWRNCRHTHPRQHPAFAEIEKVQGRIPIYAVGREGADMVCAGIFSINPLLFGNKFSLQAMCLRGPAFDDVGAGREFLLQTAAYFRKLNVGSICVCPYWFYPQGQQVENMLVELGFSGTNGSGVTSSPTGLVDLRRSSDEIFADLKSKTRQEIRRTERLGVSISPALSMEETGDFYACLSSLHRERGLDAISFAEFKATFENILKDQELGILLSAFCDHTFLGGLWVIRGPQTCHYARFVVVRNTLRQLANLTIGPALWWQGMQWAKEKGCSTLDVEGWEDNLPSCHPRYHLCKLKGRFNPSQAYVLAPHTRMCSGTTYALQKGCELAVKTANLAKGLSYQLKTRWAMYRGAGDT